MRRWARCLLGMGALFAGGAAADEGRPARGSELELTEIIVTAERRERRAEEVAMSVSVLDGAFAERVNAFDFSDLLSYAGNISLRLNPFGGTIAVRGFGNPGTNAGSESAVGVAIDNVFYGQPGFLTATFFDLDRTEVLRGPQGTLFGKNASAGLVNITTRAPEPEHSARLEVLYGTEQQRAARPVVNLALGDGLSLRLAGNIARDRGRLFNTFLDRREVNLSQDSVRGRLLWEPWGRDVRADLTVFHSRQSRNNTEFQFVGSTPAMHAFASSFDPDFNDDRAVARTSVDVPARGRIHFTGVTLNAEFDRHLPVLRLPFTLVSTTAWSEAQQKHNDLDADFTPAPFLRRTQPGGSPYRRLSQEFRMAGSVPEVFRAGDELLYTGGFFYQTSSLRVPDRFEILDLATALGYILTAQGDDPPLGIPGELIGGLGAITAQTLPLLLDLLAPVLGPLLGDEQRIDTLLDQRVHAFSFYGQTEYRFAPDWYAITGLRVGYERKNGDFRSEGQGELVALVGEQEDHVSRVELRETDLSPKVGLRWTPLDRLHVFTTWSRGIKSGGFNAIPLTPDNLSFDKERASSFEAGTKANLLQGRLRLSATAFWTHFNNLQVSAFRDNRFFILNAARARSRGGELDLHWLSPWRGLSLFTSFGYNDAQFTRYPNAPAPAGADDDTQDLTGRRLPRAPRVSATVTPAWALDLGRGTHLILSGDVQHQGSRFLDVDLAPAKHQPATTELNLRATLAGQAGLWAFTVAGQNLTDEVSFLQILDQPLAPGNFVGIRADRGRMVTASLVYEFR